MTRSTFSINRAAEFFSEKELEMQMGAGRDRWLPMLLKELVDNALDACEGAGGTPVITVALEDDAFTVTDNGHGIPPDTVAISLDYLTRTSSNNLYISPSRGQLGNALKVLYAAGYVVHDSGHVTITARGITHEITVGFDQIGGQPTLDHTTTPAGDTCGTTVRVAWPDALKDLRFPPEGPDVETLVWRYSLCNPHATITATWPGIGDPLGHPPTNPDFRKWKPNNPPSAHWFNLDQFQRFLCAFLASRPEMLVKEFLLQFAGMTSTRYQKEILDAQGLQRTTIVDAFTDDGNVLTEMVTALHDAICACGDPVKAVRLGPIGKEIGLTRQPLAIPEWFSYKKVIIEEEHRPFIAEAWFIAYNSGEATSEELVALNHSPLLQFSDDTFHHCLASNDVDDDDPVTVVLHMACPSFNFTDRGKSRINLSYQQQRAMVDALNSVLKNWKKAKSKLRRDQQADQRFMEKLEKEGKKAKVTVKAAAYAVMEHAYLKASGGGKLPADARQVMYAARRQILATTGAKDLGSQYFCYGLLPDFQADNPELTANWDVVYGDRGNLFEPHTGQQVPLGTVNVRNYTSGWDRPTIGRTVEATVPLCISTNGPRGRYGAALFIEKEGFTALFKAAQTAELYDVAIFSTKGMSTTACRSLVEHLSAEGIPIFLLHDFDASGMTIARTIQEDGRRFKFKMPPEVIDMGLRLRQAEEMGLESEPFSWGKQKKDPRENLLDCGATEEEIAFLVQKGDATRGGWAGERVELNAMTSPQFVEFVHSQLEAHGVKKVVPSQRTLAKAFRLVKKRDALDAQVQALIKQAETDGAEPEIFTTPEDLEGWVRNRVKGTTLSWIDAVMERARD